MSRTLKPEDQISHYRILGPLGAGGMGEVYRAHDESLERDVALKVLPRELVQSDERVRRFVLEAKSASSLNHPHIITIYEIGQDRIRSGDRPSEPDSSPLHFISMELVSGQTLATKIHEEKAALKTLLGWLAQAAEGLAKAHAAGIVHRDLKPSNIMITQDGYAKVLDFGLAKLTERQATSPDLSSAPTMTEERTSEGAVLGTAGYMAPEQVQGKPVDARADMFSFGCILYEAATRRRPFAAESQVETMHRILHDVPAPIEQLNPEAPAELRRLIRRSLAKDPNQRLDSMRTLALELHEIVEEYDALSTSASGSGAVAGTPVTRKPRGILVWVATGLLSVALLSVAWFAWKRPGGEHELLLRQITSNPPGLSVTACAISPDGRRVVYTDSTGVYLKTIDGGEIEHLGIPHEPGIRALAWYPDGTKLILQRSGLWAYSIAGGKLRKLWDREGDFSISPDGSRIALITRRDWRSVTETGDSAWISVMGANGENAHPILASTAPLLSPTWSPDGRHLAYVRVNDQDPSYAIQTTGMTKGDTVTVARYRGSQVGGGAPPILWTHDDRIVFGVPEGPTGDANLWDIRVDRRNGRSIGRQRRLTNAQGSIITAMSASADGRRLAFSRFYPNSDVYIARIEDRGRRLAGIRPLTRDVRYDWPMEWSRDGRAMLFISNRNGRREVFLQNTDAATPECLATAPGEAWAARFTPDGGSVLFWLDSPSTLADSGAMMRVPTSGGPFEALPHGGTHGTAQCRCSRSPQTSCVLGEVLNGELRISALDPLVGKGADIARTVLPGLFKEAWDLSPDGTRLVIAGPDSALRILDLRTKSERMVRVPGWSDFQFVSWDAEGEGWFVSSWADKGIALLRVEPDGRVFLLHNTQQWLGRQCPSPDGRWLAFAEQSFDGNVWIAERR